SLTRPGKTDHDFDPSLGHDLEALLHRSGVAHGHEAGIDAFTGDLLDGFHHVLGRRVYGVGGSEMPGELQLRVHDVDADDRIGTCDRRPLDGVEPDATTANHGDTLTCPDFCRVHNRAKPGSDRTSDEGREVERKILSHLDCRCLGHDDVRTVGGWTVVIDRFAVAVESG